MDEENTEMIASEFNLLMNLSNIETRAEDIQRALYTPAGGEATSVTGRGVIIGIVDTGIDFTHPNFSNEEVK